MPPFTLQAGEGCCQVLSLDQVQMIPPDLDFASTGFILVSIQRARWPRPIFAGAGLIFRESGSVNFDEMGLEILSAAKQTRMLAGALVLLVVATYGVMWGDGHTIFAFAGKEQLFEHLSAWLFLLSCLFSIGAWDQCRRRRSGFWRPAQFALLALFFFVAFGEELSWGQHYLGYATPEALEDLNQQGELNLHNLAIFDSQTDDGRRGGLGALLNSNRLFDYFMIGFFLLGPLGYRWVPFLQSLADRFSVPIVSGILGAPLLLNWISTAGAEIWLVDNEFRHLAVSEIRELNYALLCAVGMGLLFSIERKTQTAAS